ncbi:MAG TPA: N(4)-(beta-N-acetylglucosaminyl)-L-asparaginase [Phycisphaerales bacterium]|nr:N(4)-(beta-N-acetylglucosaminyl)-L-asparaginase [Phycisphaerales bacterium]
MSTPVLVGSWNAGPAAARALELARAGEPLLKAIVAGIQIVEDDPEEMSVGYGGLPNEDGEVELDAAVMDGPRHKAGAVAGLRRIRHAAGVAYEVLQRTDHALLVGEGAFRFARQLGFPEGDLSTPMSREAWLLWKAGLSHKDAWLSADESRSEFGRARWAGHVDNPEPGRPPHNPPPGASGGSPTAPFTFGTIHVSGLDAAGDLWACTSTSGLSYKIPGRVGDSPIVGAGLFVDNAVGSAGATGRGESTLHTCGAYEVVRGMEAGLAPVEACLAALRRIARFTREPRLLNDKGQPGFNVTLYALRKDGVVGAAAMHAGYQYVVQRGGEARVENAPPLFG